MAVNPVSLIECLRPWKNMGLHHLLFSSAQEVAALTRPGPGERRPASAQKKHDGQGHAVPPFLSASDMTASRPDSASAVPGAGSYGPGGRPDGSLPRSDGLAIKPDRPAPGPVEPALWSDRSPVAAMPGPDAPVTSQPVKTRPWPEAWEKLWQRTRPAPVLWTYAELGQDLLGQGSEQRSAMLKKLVSDLAFPKGSSVFWPCRLPGDEVVPDGHRTSPFLQGLHLLQPQVIILSGLDMAAELELSPPLNIAFTQSLYAGTLTLLLPDLSDMAREAGSFDRCVAFLRTALTGLPFLRSR